MEVEEILSLLAEEGVYPFVEDRKLKTRSTNQNIPSELISVIKNNKALLLETLSDVNRAPAIKRIEQNNNAPLSYSQQRLWMLDKIEGGSTHYHIPVALELYGELDEAVFEASFKQIIVRHESLRTVFRECEGEPIQVVMSADKFSVQQEDLTVLDDDLRSDVLTSRLQAEAVAPFDLSTDLMLRVHLIKRAELTYIALVTMHHIASDGWSSGVLIKEFSELYSAGVVGRQSELPELSVQYADYAHWQRNWLQGEVLDKQLGYWEKQLANLPVVHSLPLDKARPKEQTFAGDIYVTNVSQKIHQTLEQQCKAAGATLFMGLHAAFSVLLSRYSNETDIVVGCPIANREQEEVAELIGFFVNTLVLRSDLSGAPSFTDLLTQSKAMLLDAYAHQQVPFEQIVERLQPPRSLSHSPLFQVMLVLQNNEQSELTLPGLSLSPMINEEVTAKYDITLNVVEEAGGLSLQWDYNSSLFKDETIERMSKHFVHLLTELITKPQENVFRLSMLNKAECDEQLVKLNDTAQPYSQEKCIHELFEDQAKAQPDEVSVVFGEQRLTYEQLNGKANQLAQYLVEEKGIKPDSLVGICVERSLDMLVGILGILKAGGAYVPLDPNYPAARLAYMLEDAQLDTVISHSGVVERTPISENQAVCLDNELVQMSLANYTTDNIEISQLGLTPSNLAYIIYTSGSTGNPKGVMIEHGNTVAFLNWAGRAFTQAQLSSVLASTSMCFDLSVFEFFAALSHGGKVVIVENILALQASETKVKINEPISLINTVPSAIEALLSSDAIPASVQTVNLAGELLKQITVERLYQAGIDKVYDLYGPSEDTTYSTYTLRQPGGRPTIGRAIDNSKVYVLNEARELLPIGVPGELYIAGRGLARGYLNREDLTAEIFIENPFFDEQDPTSSKRLYRTSDLVRWLPEGELEYLGRLDQQVKIRGFRIELGEIESRLLSHELVNDLVVVANDTATQSKQLVAYVVLSVDHEKQVQDKANFVDILRTYLGETLPEYMIPSIFMVLDALPLTPNGKVDKKALPQAEVSDQQDEYVAPQTETEQVLCRLWQDVLGLKEVGLNDDFFSLGGHSLLATRLISAINKQFSINISIKTLFTEPTIARLEKVVSSSRGAMAYPPINLCDRNKPLPLSYAQKRLWMLDKIEGGSTHYHIPVALELYGELDEAVFEASFKQIIVRHESLRTVFRECEGEPIQVVMSADKFSVQQEDLTVLDDDLRSDVLTSRLQAEAVAPFDLSTDLMLRVHLIKRAELTYIALVTMHHIASDGWSSGVLIKEFSELYSAGVVGRQSELPELSVQYADYAHWQRNWLQGEVLDKQLGYWEKQLANLPVVHSLPLDKARPKEQTFAGDIYVTNVSQKIHQTLEQQCKAAGATLFMGLHAAFSVLLSRYSNETDIVVGCPIANREQEEVAELIGFFVNTLVLRSDLSGAPSFTDLLTQSKAMLLDAYAHQQVPFEQIVERLQPPRSLSHSPLFQVMLVLQNNEQSELTLPGLSLSPMINEEVTAKYDITLNVVEEAGGLSLQWDYNSSLFKDETIERMSKHFVHLLTELITKPQENVFRLSMLNKAECDEQLVKLNDTAQPYSQEKCIHELFEDQAKAQPDEVSVVFGEQRLTYEQLNGKANQLAQYLVEEKGIKPDSLVGICVERSLDMLVGILGILKAGGAYVPLDPNYPAARLAYMLEDAQLDTVISHSGVVERTPISENQAVCLDNELVQMSLANYTTDNIEISQLGLTPSNLAYIIYTSGSTGNPKGVMIEHGNTVAFLNWAGRAFTQAQLSSVLASTSMCFDLSVFEFFAALSHGGKVVIVENILALQASETKVKINEPISLINTVPSAIEALLSSDAIPASVQTVNLAGELLKQITVERLYQAGIDKVYDLYGPSEDTTYSTYTLRQPGGRPTIGRAIDNSKVYVLNEARELLPIGVPGELYIAGRGLARGYLNREDLTAEIFIENPFFDEQDPTSSKRLYRTSDLVRWLPEGELEYLGRLDQQVKIRGFRIELGEIESRLLSHDLVNDLVVVANDTATQSKQLMAYVVLSVDHEKQAQDKANFVDILRTHLGKMLPEYMIPSIFMVLDALPLTPNGKVDKKALPQAEVFMPRAEYVAPVTELEKSLVLLWSELLNIEPEKLSTTAKFFELGGDSILSIQLVGRAAKLGINLTVKQLFEYQSIQVLAPKIQNNKVIESPQEAIAGSTYLLPIQLEFLAEETGINHYNQSMLLVTPESFEAAFLPKILAYLYQRHDALRLRFTPENKSWNTKYEPLSENLVEQSIWYKHIGDKEFSCIEEIAEQAQQSLCLATGPLLRAVYVTNDESPQGRLLLIVHHMAVDGVSWRILLADLQVLYGQICQGQPLILDPKSSSFKQWGAFLQNYAQSESLLSERDYWLGVASEPVEKLMMKTSCTEITSDCIGTVSDLRTVDVLIDAQTTEDLLKRAPSAFRTTINELLLASLLLGLNRWNGLKSIQIDLEGHGREPLTDTLNLGQTVGWFTSLFPFVLETEAFDIGTVICSIKDAYRSIPNHGIGFGLLKHITGEAALASHGYSDIVFNYLGQFDQIANSVSDFGLGREPIGETVNGNRPLNHGININGLVGQGVLSFKLGYDQKRYKAEQMEDLALNFQNAIKEITQYCVNDLANLASKKDVTSGHIMVDTADEIDVAGLSDSSSSLDSTAIKMSDGPQDTNLFCFHPYGGTVSCYLELAEALSNTGRFYGMQTPALMGNYKVNTIETLASDFVKSIRAVQPEGPYMLLGWSLGGVLAYEAAVQLEREGEEVAYLGLFDCHAFPEQMGNIGDKWYSPIQEMYGDKLDWSEITDKSQALGTELVMRQAVERGYTPEGIEKDSLVRYFHYLADIAKALREYQPGASYVNVDVFKAQKYAEGDDAAKDFEDYGWSGVTKGNIHTIDVTGNHNNMVFQPHVEGLAEKLSERLTQLRTENSYYMSTELIL
jgi:amino acid adenylation domain-containing protein/non-ribosomal peptide synthase protein (TIGR01720 family)